MDVSQALRKTVKVLTLDTSANVMANSRTQKMRQEMFQRVAKRNSLASAKVDTELRTERRKEFDAAIASLTARFQDLIDKDCLKSAVKAELSFPSYFYANECALSNGWHNMTEVRKDFLADLNHALRMQFGPSAKARTFLSCELLITADVAQLRSADSEHASSKLQSGLAPGRGSVASKGSHGQVMP